MLILGLETSCDETGVALYDTERGLVAAPVAPKDVTLVTGDMALASVVSDLTGARVRVMHRRCTVRSTCTLSMAALCRKSPHGTIYGACCH